MWQNSDAECRLTNFIFNLKNFTIDLNIAACFYKLKNMGEMDIVTILHQELTSANLRAYGIKRKGNSIYLVYDDSRTDKDKLDPIKDKYHPQFKINTAFGFNLDKVKQLGFSPQSIGERNWSDLEVECDIVEFSLIE